MASHPIYQLYAELDDFKPKIWRRFQVSANITVARLGYIIMTMYEMTASHLLAIENERPFPTHSGRLSKRMELISRYDMPGGDDEWKDSDSEDATKTKLSQINLDPPVRLVVRYDFGDDWRVVVTLEEIITNSNLSGKELPRVLDGKGYGIVEDCGGTSGLLDLVEAYKSKQGDEYENYREWLSMDDFDIAAFDIDDMNFRLTKIPRIYKQIYEDGLTPTQKSIDLIERKYKR